MMKTESHHLMYCAPHREHEVVSVEFCLLQLLQPKMSARYVCDFYEGRSESEQQCDTSFFFLFLVIFLFLDPHIIVEARNDPF